MPGGRDLRIPTSAKGGPRSLDEWRARHTQDTHTQGSLMKKEWLVTNVAAVRSPGNAERAILEVILARRFLTNSGVFAVGEPLCEAGTPS